MTDTHPPLSEREIRKEITIKKKTAALYALDSCSLKDFAFYFKTGNTMLDGYWLL
jgi:hypothetical protein